MIWGGGPAASDWDRLLAEARDGAVLAHEPMHGELHWRGVAWAGLRIAELREGLRPDVMVAFGLLHDCRRETDDWDPEHGDRAARVAARSGPLKRLLGAEGRDLVAEACRLHERGRTCPEEPRIGACWDADRVNLVRLGFDLDLVLQLRILACFSMCDGCGDLMLASPSRPVPYEGGGEYGARQKA